MEIIQRIDRFRGKRRITFESGWQIWLTEKQDPGFPLDEGTIIAREKIRRFVLLHQYPQALEKAVSMLALRACSRKEIEDRLSRLHYDREAVELVLYKLQSEDLIDDASFSEQWVSSRMKKYGASRIAHELRIKGVDRETINGVMESCTEEIQLETAVSLAYKKIKAVQDTDRKKVFQRITGMLCRRGYSFETARTAFEQAFEKVESENG